MFQHIFKVTEIIGMCSKDIRLNISVFYCHGSSRERDHHEFSQIQDLATEVFKKEQQHCLESTISCIQIYYFKINAKLKENFRPLNIVQTLHTLFSKFDEGSPRQRSSDLQPFRDDSGGDQLVLWDFLVQLLVCWFVKQHLVVQLVTDFSFGPLLQLQ